MSKTYFINSQGFGLDVIQCLADKGIRPDGVFYLSNERYNSDKVSGYVESANFLKSNNIKGIPLESYDLSSEKDKAVLKQEDIEVLVILGWQRLLPEWLIKKCKIACVGGHGSPFGITAGRGRSPQNWALILGSKSFELSLFKTRPGVDDGEILLSTSFNYDENDDIRSSYLKTTIAYSDMLACYLLDPSKFIPKPQTGDAYYLPQRTPEDGLIDWTLASITLSRFIKALTRPYPGAFGIYNGIAVRIWASAPIDVPFEKNTPGEIVFVSSESEFIIKTGKGCLYVKDWDSEIGWCPKVGMVLTGENFSSQLNRILSRHVAKYPDAKPNPILYSIMEKGLQ